MSATTTFLLVEGVSFVLAAVVHSGALLPDRWDPGAAIAESVIVTVLLTGICLARSLRAGTLPDDRKVLALNDVLVGNVDVLLHRVLSRCDVARVAGHAVHGDGAAVGARRIGRAAVPGEAVVEADRPLWYLHGDGFDAGAGRQLCGIVDG